MKKIAIITGTRSGIGKGIVEMLKEEFLIVEANRPECDLTKPEKIKEFVKKVIKEHGRIDLLINNAGVGKFDYIEKISEEDWDLQYNTNVKGLWLITKEILPIMKKQDSGNIINVGSLASETGFVKGGGYAATKFAVKGLTQSLKLELRDYRIKVSLLMPGSTNTEFFKNNNYKSQSYPRQLVVEDVVKAARLLATQSETSDIDKIVLRPGLKKV